MTSNEYKHLWATPGYADRVRAIATLLKSDGCSGLLPLYRPGCEEHDIVYRTGFDALKFPCGRLEADKRLRWYAQMVSRVGYFSPVGWGRQAGLFFVGWLCYTGNQRFPGELEIRDQIVKTGGVYTSLDVLRGVLK